MSAEAPAVIPVALAQRVLARQRLSEHDLRVVSTVKDILALGALADDVRRRRHGTRTTFVRVHEIDQGAPDSWDRPVPAAATEVRIVGCPASLADALECVRRARDAAGTRVIRGFTLEELASRCSEHEVASDFARIAAAGLNEVAFVGAESARASLVRLARTAGLGVRVVAAESSVADPVGWLLEARALHDSVGGFEAVAPLPRRQDAAAPTTGFHDVRVVALARMSLETMPTVQVDWSRYGPKLAQVALTVGADDLDGVSAADDQSLGPRRTALEDVRRNISAAGLTPTERDGRFAAVI